MDASEHALSVDIIEVIESSRVPMTLAEIWADVRVWPIPRGEPMRSVDFESVRNEVAALVESEQVDEIAHKPESIYRIRREVKKEITQRTLF